MLPRWSSNGLRPLRGGGGGNDGEDERLLIAEDEVSDRPRTSQRVPKVPKAKVEDDEPEEIGLLPLGPQSRPPKPPPIQCLEVDIQPNETLTSLSLKYNIPVAELKRVNNLLTDNAFFALKRIKIPVKAASLLTELLPMHLSQTQQSNNGWIIKSAPGSGGSGLTSSSTPTSEAELGGSDVGSDAGLAPLHAGSDHSGQDLSAATTSKNKTRAHKFLKNVDKDLQRIREKQEALVQTSNIPLPLEDVEVTPTGPSGPSGKCGIVCIALIVVAILVILLIAKHETYELDEEFHRNHSEKAHHAQSHH